MLFLIILLIQSPCTSSKNAGTVLFRNKGAWLECWSENDLARLRARKTFEELIPPEITPDKINNRYIKNTLKYFKRALRFVDKDIDRYSGQILKDALLDTIGAHLTSEILPNTRFAYYAGYVHYRSAREIHDFLDEIKNDLNTQGLGWKLPERVPQWSNLSVAKIQIGVGKFFDPCACLVTKRDSNSCIHLPSPKLDDYATPTALALPFKTGGLVNLASPNSVNILLKYYTTASRCILHSSPESCRHADFVNLNNEMWHWMKRDVAPHLADEHLYAAYGGVLRIAAAVQNYGKGLSRRNLFDYQGPVNLKWRPWTALTQSYIYFNADWTPKLYIGLVVLAALAISLLQICYNYMFGDAKACSCKGRSSKSSITKDVEYSHVDTNIPAMLPKQSAVLFSDNNINRTKRSSKNVTSSLGSVKTQKVYDLNENAEKVMAVIMSDNEDFDVESAPSKPESDEDFSDKNICDVGQISRPRSPPKLETSISQLRVKRSPHKKTKSRAPMYSTSTVTQSDVTYCQRQVSKYSSSETGSSISEQSVCSTSSKSRSRLSRSSRDLAWARRVISTHSSRGLTKTTSETELELNSFTTPPSHR